MKIKQEIYTSDKGWLTKSENTNFDVSSCNIVMAFGAKDLVNSKEAYQNLWEKYPNSEIITCSTAGEIAGLNVQDNTIVSTAIEFEKTEVKPIVVNIEDFENSFEAGIHLAEKLNTESLKHVLIISDGQLVNGSELMKGTNSILTPEIPVTGGLAGDGNEFLGTIVGLNDDLREGNIVGIGFHGDQIKIGFGTHGGWDEFGPHRKVTKSNGNVLFEVDDQNALALYKKYLGQKAEELPGSALLFPLSMREHEMHLLLYVPYYL